MGPPDGLLDAAPAAPVPTVAMAPLTPLAPPAQSAAIGAPPRAVGAGGWTAAGAPARGRELVGGCRELAGKLLVYYLVRLRPQRRARRGTSDLASLVAEVYRRDPRHAVFLLERLCYDVVLGRWRAGDEPRHLLDAGAAGPLPDKSMILLHAGLGMALAEIHVCALAPGSSAAAIDGALERFAGQVRANARPELAAVAFEALGVMVRGLRARILAAVAARLQALDETLAAYFWHGAGRAIYFLPGLLVPVPGGAARGLAICRREPPLPGRRLDAIAGFCFASTMVNLRRPERVARLLPYLDREEVEALACGVAAALVTRHHTSPDEAAVRAFLRPLAARRGDLGADRSVAALWDEAVRQPSAEVLDRAYPLLLARGELASLARHRPLAAVLAPSNG